MSGYPEEIPAGKGIVAVFSGDIRGYKANLTKFLDVWKCESSFAEAIPEYEERRFYRLHSRARYGEKVFYVIAPLDHDLDAAVAAMKYVIWTDFGKKTDELYQGPIPAPDVDQNLAPVIIQGKRIDVLAKHGLPYTSDDFYIHPLADNASSKDSDRMDALVNKAAEDMLQQQGECDVLLNFSDEVYRIEDAERFNFDKGIYAIFAGEEKNGGILLRDLLSIGVRDKTTLAKTFEKKVQKYPGRYTRHLKDGWSLYFRFAPYSHDLTAIQEAMAFVHRPPCNRTSHLYRGPHPALSVAHNLSDTRIDGAVIDVWGQQKKPYYQDYYVPHRLPKTLEDKLKEAEAKRQQQRPQYPEPGVYVSKADYDAMKSSYESEKETVQSLREALSEKDAEIERLKALLNQRNNG